MVQRSKLSVLRDSCGHLFSVSIQNSAVQVGIAATEAEALHHADNTMTSTTTAFNHTQLKPLVYDKSTAPFMSCLAKKLVYMSGDPRKRQWIHQCLFLDVVRGNAAKTLACVQV